MPRIDEEISGRNGFPLLRNARVIGVRIIISTDFPSSAWQFIFHNAIRGKYQQFYTSLDSNIDRLSLTLTSADYSQRKDSTVACLSILMTRIRLILLKIYFARRNMFPLLFPFQYFYKSISDKKSFFIFNNRFLNNKSIYFHIISPIIRDCCSKKMWMQEAISFERLEFISKRSHRTFN